VKQAVIIILGCILSWHLSAQTPSFRQTGAASYYADKFHGRKTASGERYNRKKYTAAHLTLPLGTELKVTNLVTGKSIIVKVNDRGPHTNKYCIDLSKAAARALGVIGDSKNEVLLETALDSLEQPALKAAPPPLKQIDSVWFNKHLFAENQFFNLTAQEVVPKGFGYRLYNYKELNYTIYLARKIGRYIAGDTVYIQPITSKKGVKEYTIWVGEFVSIKQTAKLKRQLIKFGIRKPLLKPYP
jgi:rare lipoprotein A